MLYLLTAPPGSGKSQYAIERFILDAIRENEAAIAAWKKLNNPDKPPPIRRQVYTNIKGMLQPERVAKIQAMVGGLPIMASPDDWRECPDGSMVIYDEAQQKHLFRATGSPGVPTIKNAAGVLVEDERITGLDTHRHRGFDIVMITQEVGLIHHWAKKFVGSHVDLERVAGAEMMTVREWGKYQATPGDFHARQAADTSLTRMHKSTWDLYDSATIHTHVFKLPSGAKFAIRMGLAMAVLIPLLMVGAGWFGAPDVSAAESVDAAPSSIADKVLAPIASSGVPVVAPAPLGINGCASGRHCRCWDDAGVQLVMDDAMCRNLAEGVTPMPINLNRFQGSSGERPRGNGDSGAATPAPGAVVGVTTSPTSVGSPSQGSMQGRMPDTLTVSGG